MLERILDVERGLFLSLNGWGSSFWDAFFYLASAQWIWFAFVPFFLFFLFYHKPPKEGLFILLAVLLSILICDQLSSTFIKPYVARFRPSQHPDFIDAVRVIYGYRGGRYGFISGHATNFVSLAVLTSLIFRNRFYSISITLLTFLVIYSRIYIGVHFISDVIPGAIVGFIVGNIVYKIYLWSRSRWMKPPFPLNPSAVYAGDTIQVWSFFLIGFIVFLLFASRQLLEVISHYVFLNF